MESPATLGLVSRIGNLFSSPARTFGSLITKPDWVTPMIVTAIIALTFSIALKDVIMDFQSKAVRASIMKNDKIAESQKTETAEQAVSMMKKFWLVGAVFGTLAGVGLYFIIGLAYWVVANKMLGGKPHYFQVLSIYGYAMLIESFGLLIKMPIMAATGTMRVDTGLTLLVPDAEITSIVYIILSKFDVFSLWALVLVMLGLAQLYQKPVSKSALTVAVIWLAGLLLSIGMSTLGMSTGGL